MSMCMTRDFRRKVCLKEAVQLDPSHRGAEFGEPDQRHKEGPNHMKKSVSENMVPVPASTTSLGSL